jgi:hypothetical protein
MARAGDKYGSHGPQRRRYALASPMVGYQHMPHVSMAGRAREGFVPRGNVMGEFAIDSSPRIGQVVLFCIDDGRLPSAAAALITENGKPFQRPQVWRPFLIVAYQRELDAAQGEVFLSWQQDRLSPWCLRNLFHLPDSEHRMVEVASAAHGTELGQWMTREEMRTMVKYRQSQEGQEGQEDQPATEPPAPSEPSEPAKGPATTPTMPDEDEEPAPEGEEEATS